jgi:transposase-like protein
MKRDVNKYTDDFRLKVALEYLNTTQSQKEILDKYGIQGSNCITDWIRKFELRKPSIKDLEARLQMTKRVKKTKLEKYQDSKIKKLEELLRREQLKTEALDTMIDIAEDHLKVSIRKKSGSKQ